MSNVPNNPAIVAGDLVFIGGTPPLDSSGHLVAAGDAAGQTVAVLARMEAVLRQAGMDLSNLVFVTLYLKDLADYPAVNAAYGAGLPRPYPARKVIGNVPMTLQGMLVEMTAIASRQPRTILTPPA